MKNRHSEVFIYSCSKTLKAIKKYTMYITYTSKGVFFYTNYTVCIKIINPLKFKYLGPVVRKVDSAIHWIVIFSRAAERHKKTMTLRMELARDKQ